MNEFAVSAANVGDGLQRSASALQLAGNTIQESAAMVTGITEVTQQPEKAGSGLKILSLRLRGMKGDLEELGEEIDPNVESISKMQTQLLNLTHGKVNIFKDDGSFKSTYQIMKEISEIYDHLTDTERADLLETIAGKNRSNDVAALISNWSQVEKALDAANNAAGTAQEEQDKYMKSMQGHIDQLTATWQVLATDLINSDFLKGIISGATSLLDIVDKIVNGIGTLPTLIGAIAAGLSFKNIGVFKTMNGEITIFGDNLSKVSSNLKTLFDDFKNTGSLFKAVSNVFSGDKRGIFSNEYIQEQNKDIGLLKKYQNDISQFGGNLSKEEAIDKNLKNASTAALDYAKNTDKARFSIEEFKKQQDLMQIGTVAQTKGLSSASSIIGEYNKGFKDTAHTQEDFLKTVTQSNQGLGNYLSGLNGAQGSLSGYIGSLISAKAATMAMQAATMALNMALSMGVAFAVSAAITEIMKLADSMDTSFAKATERAKESKRVFEESASDVDEVKTRLDDVKAKISESKSKSLTDPKDIANLEKQKELLEAQLKIKEQIAKTNEEKANKDAETALTQKRGYNIETLKDKDNIIDKSYFLSGSGGATNSSLYYGNIIEETRKKQELLNKATEKYNELVIKHSKTKDSNKWKQEEKEIDQLSRYINNLSTEVNDNVTNISDQVDTLVGKTGYEKAVKDAQSVYKDVEDGVKQIQSTSQIAEGMGIDLSKLLGGDSKDFESKVDSYITKINELESAKNKIANGSLTDDDKKNLFYDFPELKGQTNNLDSAITSLVKDMDANVVSEFSDQMKNLDSEGAITSMQALQDSVMGIGEAMVNVDDLTTSLKSAQEDFSALGTAINESNSATGLSIESMEKLETMYSDIKGYDSASLFEKTANGIRLNTDELNRLNQIYEKNHSKEFSDSLKQLNEDLAVAQEAQKRFGKDEAGYQTWQTTIDGIKNQITQVENLSSMWDTATSAYNKYIQAQAGGTNYDTLESFIKDKENIEKMMKAGWGDANSVTTYWDAIFGEDRMLSNQEALEQFGKTIENTGHALNDYLVFENGELQSSGFKTLFEDIQSGLGEDYATKLKDGTNELNLQGTHLQEIAEYLGIDVGFAERLTNVMNDMPDFSLKFDGVDTGSNAIADNIARIVSSVDEAKAKLSELQDSGQISNKIDLDFDMNTASLSDFENQIQQLKSIKIDAKVNPEGAAALDTLIQKTEHEYYVKINTDTGGQLDVAVQKVQEIKDRIEELKSKAGDSFDIKAAVEGDDKIKEAASELSKLPPEVTTAVGIEVHDGGVQGVLNQLKEAPESISIPVNYVVGDKPEEIKYEDQNVQVTYNVDAPAEPKYKNQDPNVTYHMHAPPEPTYNNISKTVTYTIKTVGSAPSGANRVDGTAHISGTAHAQGTAFKQGYWGTKNSGFALGGEEDIELLVRNGHWYTIGEDSTEFFGYKKGDIIFNAEQTKQIFEKGKITHGKKRGTSLSTGTAFADGTAFRRGSSSKSSKKEDKKLKAFQDWFAKLFDWIEIKLKRQTDKITQYTKKADESLKAESYKTASKNYRSAISATATQIQFEQTAGRKYQSEANKVLNKAIKKGIISKSKAKNIKNKVTTGTLNIAEYSERVREVIKDYQTWNDKAISAKDSITDLHYKIREYIKDLKDVRDAERKAKIERYESFQTIATSSYISDAGGYRLLNISQYDYQNKVLRNSDNAYSQEISKITSDNKQIRKNTNKSIKSDLKSNKKQMRSKKANKKLKKYNKALNNAKNAIKAKKKVSSNDLKIIKKHSIDTYEKIYAYNLSFDNVENAKLERAVAYATNSAKIFENISKQYEKIDSATKNEMDLNRSKAKNTINSKTANKLLDKVGLGYDIILANDKSEINQYKSNVNKYSKTITNKNGYGSNYNKIDTKTRKDVNKFIKLAKARVKSKVAISASILSNLAKYNVKGYVSNAFYNACINYNNALEHKRQAEAQFEIDKQTAITEKIAIAQEKFNNIENEYGNNEKSIDNNRQLINAKQTTKETRGLSLSKTDYQKLQEYNTKSIQNYKKEITALDSVIKQNLKLYKEYKNSQAYKDNLNTLAEYKVKLEQLNNEQEELNNKIAQIPYDKYKKALDKLDELYKARTTYAELNKSLGKDVAESHYLLELETNEKQIKKAQERVTKAYADYQQSLANPDKVYGGKSSDDWHILYNQFRTELYNLQIEAEKLKDTLRDDVYWRDFERAHKEAERLQDILSSLSNLITDDMYFDKNGEMTEWGIDQVANLTKQYENARNEIENYSNDIQNLTKLYADGWYTQDEYNEKLSEFQKKLLDSASNMKKYMESIKDIYKEIDKSELDALFKLIDARNDALKKKKEYYDYDRNIKNKTKDIQELQSQIIALEGMSDAASKSKRAKLQAELEEKQEDLDDTIFDHNIDLSQDALDDMKQLLQDEFDDKWEKITQDLDAMKELLLAANNLTNANMSSVITSLNKLLNFYGINSTTTKIMDSYASGTKQITKSKKAFTNENGNEIIVTKQGLITPLKLGDGIIPADMTKRLYDMAMGVTSNIQTPKIQIPNKLLNSNFEVLQHYDSLINIEGSADAATVQDLKNMKSQLLESSYQYTTNRIKQDNIRTGGVRRL